MMMSKMLSWAYVPLALWDVLGTYLIVSRHLGDEMNPLVRWMISLPGGWWLFFAVKLLSIMLVFRLSRHFGSSWAAIAVLVFVDLSLLLVGLTSLFVMAFS